MDIVNYGLHEKYDQLKKFGDKLSDMRNMVDWDQIRPILDDLYKNHTEVGGRHNFDPVFMAKILFLQSLYGLVDETMEKEVYDRISFINFLDYPESIPDSMTIWLFRERLSSTGKDKMIWEGIWKEFEEKGIRVKSGTIQDASYVESDPRKHGKKKLLPIDPNRNLLKFFRKDK